MYVYALWIVRAAVESFMPLCVCRASSIGKFNSNKHQRAGKCANEKTSLRNSLHCLLAFVAWLCRRFVSNAKFWTKAFRSLFDIFFLLSFRGVLKTPQKCEIFINEYVYKCTDGCMRTFRYACIYLYVFVCVTKSELVWMKLIGILFGWALEMFGSGYSGVYMCVLYICVYIYLYTIYAYHIIYI